MCSLPHSPLKKVVIAHLIACGVGVFGPEMGAIAASGQGVASDIQDDSPGKPATRTVEFGDLRIVITLTQMAGDEDTAKGSLVVKRGTKILHEVFFTQPVTSQDTLGSVQIASHQPYEKVFLALVPGDRLRAVVINRKGEMTRMPWEQVFECQKGRYLVALDTTVEFGGQVAIYDLKRQKRIWLAKDRKKVDPYFIPEVGYSFFSQTLPSLIVPRHRLIAKAEPLQAPSPEAVRASQKVQPAIDVTTLTLLPAKLSKKEEKKLERCESLLSRVSWSAP